ncbi:MAG TPA: tetratricopeptide repeat protein [Ktedonobacteraceae bacterium]|nr:tetratricopeptide repeat protein [Ktedonobacteraceae bacterium]
MSASTIFNEPAPETWAQWINRGHRLQHEEQYADALSAYEQAIICNPQDASAYEYLAELCKKLGLYESALAVYQRVLGLDPTFPHFYLYKGEVLKKLHRYAEALTTFEQAMALVPEEVALYD